MGQVRPRFQTARVLKNRNERVLEMIKILGCDDMFSGCKHLCRTCSIVHQTKLLVHPHILSNGISLTEWIVLLKKGESHRVGNEGNFKSAILSY